jgi:hypothetical protein
MPAASTDSTPPGPKSTASTALVSENAYPYDLGALRRVGRRNRAARAFHFLFFTAGAVPNCDFVSGFDQIRGHRPSHNSHA